jgi:hypothetical protein
MITGEDIITLMTKAKDLNNGAIIINESVYIFVRTFSDRLAIFDDIINSNIEHDSKFPHEYCRLCFTSGRLVHGLCDKCLHLYIQTREYNFELLEFGPPTLYRNKKHHIIIKMLGDKFFINFRDNERMIIMGFTFNEYLTNKPHVKYVNNYTKQQLSNNVYYFERNKYPKKNGIFCQICGNLINNNEECFCSAIIFERIWLKVKVHFIKYNNFELLPEINKYILYLLLNKIMS